MEQPARPSLVELAHRFRDQVDERFVAMAQPIVRALHAVHPVRFDGLENLPEGPALLVGNHGLLGYETALFFERIYSATGRLPRGCADRWFFRVPLLRDLLVRIGGMYGAPQNADHALSRGELVVCYPGGAREVFKHDDAQRYRLRWEKSAGFARVALRNRVPIIPFAAAGVDDTYSIVSRLRGTGRLLMGDDKYDLPLLVGRGPFPEPVPFWFRIGRPIGPLHDALEHGASELLDVDVLHRRAWECAQSLLDELVVEWRAARRPPASISEDVASTRDVPEPACAY